MKTFLTILIFILSVNAFSQSMDFRIDTIALAEGDTDNYHFTLKVEHNNKKFLSQYLFFLKNNTHPVFEEHIDTTLSDLKDKNEFRIYIDESGSYIQINLNPNTKTEYLVIRKLIIYKSLASKHYECNTAYYDDRKRKLKVIKSEFSEYEEKAPTQLSTYTLIINGKSHTFTLTETETTGRQSSNGVYTKSKLSKERQEKFMRHHRFKRYCSVTTKLKVGIIQL